MKPHTNNSFSYKTIHPNIRSILDERSKLDNTVQVSMPFIKATTTLAHPDILGPGNIGFTLGVHTDQDRQYTDIFASQTGEYLVGYTYQPNGTNRPIYINSLGVPAGTENIVKILDLGTDFANNTGGFSAVPPPGITKATVGKRRSGLISVANISFSVPTLWQLEFLHRSFLIPGIGMILEWGQQFAPKGPGFTLGETGLIDDLSEYMFPWYGQNAYGETKEELFERLARNQISTQEILEKYSYPTQGQYQWMFGRVGNFNINSNPDGSYECMVRIVGPAEDSWAYSVRNTSVPPTKRGIDAKVCIDDTNSVEMYFTKEAGIDSFIGVLQATTPRDGSTSEIQELAPWKDFVKFFKKPKDNTEETTSQDSAEDLEDAYFISWRYFVNVILNDENYGVKSIFRNANELPEWLDKISLLRKYSNINGDDTETSNFEDPYENFVGTNVFLRSTDLSTMIIVNEAAAERAEQDFTLRGFDEFFKYDSMTAGIQNMGDFYKSTEQVINPPKSSDQYNDRAFLSTGVWINHKAIIQSFATAGTILEGIQNLLTRMSSATNGYWNLVIDVSEPIYSDEIEIPAGALSTYSYSVVDLNYAEHSEYAIQEFLGGEKRVHVFNKYIREKDGTLIGSDLTDAKVELSLPQTMFSQIATLGLVQPEDTPVGEEQTNEPAVISNINDKLREMFSITSIARRPDGTSADLTALPVNRDLVGICSGKTTTRDEAGILTGGIADRSITDLSTTEEIDEVENNIQELITELEQFIQECGENCERETLPETQEPELTDIRKISELSIGEIKQRQSNRHLHAVGRYQITGPTLSEAQQFLNLSDSTIFSPEIQNRFMEYLLLNKPGRENLSRYLKGESTNLKLAQLDLAREFASISIPSGIEVTLFNGAKVNITDGESKSFYEGDAAGNSAKVTSGVVAGALINAQSFKTLIQLKIFVGRAESGGDGFNAANVLPVRGGKFYPLPVNSLNYKRAINNLPYIGVRGLANPSRPEPRFVQGDTCPAISSDPATKLSSDGKRFITAGTCNGALTALSSAKRRLAQLTLRRQEIPRENKLTEIKRKFPHLGSLYRYFEPFPDYMTTNIRKVSNGNSSNAFGAAPASLSIKADLELPGINGLRLGELFWLDRIPSFYRAYGAFIVLGLEEEITPNGWITKIGSTFYYLGNAWKTQMARILSGEPES